MKKWLLLFFMITIVSLPYVKAAEEPPAHAWGSWKILSEPSCEDPGLREHTCHKCKLTMYEPIPPLGHTLHTNVLQAATCKEGGKQQLTCARCDYWRSEPIPALAHEFVEQVTDPDCTHVGERASVCRLCGETVITPIAMLGHNWASWITEIAPSVEREGYAKRYCLHNSSHYEERNIPTLSSSTASSKQEISKSSSVESTTLEATTPNSSTQLEPWTEPEFEPLPQLEKPLLNQLDYILMFINVLVIVYGLFLVYPYLRLFLWVRRKKKLAIQRLYGGWYDTNKLD